MFEPQAISLLRVTVITLRPRWLSIPRGFFSDLSSYSWLAGIGAAVAICCVPRSALNRERPLLQSSILIKPILPADSPKRVSS
jgi:hypothetical protein